MTKQSNSPEEAHQKTEKALVIFQSPSNFSEKTKQNKKKPDRQNND